MRKLLLAFPGLALSACVTVYPPEAADSCRIDEAKPYINRTASAEIGAELLRITHTRELRWMPPGTMVTMDYRMGRLTVSYDETMRINRISCG